MTWAAFFLFSLPGYLANRATARRAVLRGPLLVGSRISQAIRGFLVERIMEKYNNLFMRIYMSILLHGIWSIVPVNCDSTTIDTGDHYRSVSKGEHERRVNLH